MSRTALTFALAGGLALLATSPLTAETYIVPVVTSGVGGAEGSFWESEVRIVRLTLDEEVTVRRTWVALDGGGYYDASPAPPEWSMPPSQTLYMLVLTGTDLLEGSGAQIGAVGLEIEGDVDVFLHVANTKGMPPIEIPGGVPCCLPGSGQTARLAPGALAGPSRATWVSVGTGVFRANLGIVNPNPVPITMRIELSPFYDDEVARPTGWKGPWVNLPFTVITIPSYGWVQLSSPYENLLCAGGINPICPGPGQPLSRVPGPAAFRFLPEGDTPYAAYVSLVYSPTNDPEFVPVLSGDFDLGAGPSAR